MKNGFRITGETAEIFLPCGRTALIDAADLVLVGDYRWYSSEQSGGNIYAVSQHAGKSFKLSNWLMRPPPHLVVDHINGDGLDNRRCNLRICTQAQNSKNQARRRVYRHPKGVTQTSKTGWHAKICCNGVKHNLGKFSSSHEAALAYDEAARRLFGEFARLNFPAPTATAA